MNRRLQQYLNGQSFQAGFSLIELLVSMTIFIVVLTIASGALLTLVDGNVKTQNHKLAMSNLAFVLESMTREIRTGTNWWCGEITSGEHIRGNTNNTNDSHYFPKDNTGYRDCDDSTANLSKEHFLSIVESGSSLTGKNGTGNCDSNKGSNRVTYYLKTDSTSNRGQIYRLLGNCAGAGGVAGEAVPITPDSINITSMKFIVEGTQDYGGASTDQVQPTATIKITGNTADPGAPVDQLDTSFEIQTTVTQRLLDV